ncbi:MAG: hypothetical protein V1847_03230 [Candidatus Diapherotrites archaeon]
MTAAHSKKPVRKSILSQNSRTKSGTLAKRTGQKRNIRIECRNKKWGVFIEEPDREFIPFKNVERMAWFFRVRTDWRTAIVECFKKNFGKQTASDFVKRAAYTYFRQNQLVLSIYPINIPIVSAKLYPTTPANDKRRQNLDLLMKTYHLDLNDVQKIEDRSTAELQKGKNVGFNYNYIPH